MIMLDKEKDTVHFDEKKNKPQNSIVPSVGIMKVNYIL